MVTYLLSYKSRDPGMRWETTKYTEYENIADALHAAERHIRIGYAVHLQPLKES